MGSGGVAKKDLFEAAHRCLASADPDQKVALAHELAADYRSGKLQASAQGTSAEPIGNPGKPALPRLIEPRNLPQRGLGSDEGRAALVHAIAHIEFNAINLACDAVYRFRGMPEAYYADWVGIAEDEARHFRLLTQRLRELGHAYGDFDAHNGLWEMAVLTADSCLQRMALVPRVLEARGLDVTPAMIHRLRSVGDSATADVLEIILREEVPHVAAGSRWFAWCCEQEGVEPESTFAALLELHMKGSLRGPFNLEARRAAGFSAAELVHIGSLAA
ncbi:ferritin-like domain-containing protein [Dokdonella sp.]|uniref:ferritin-like domain-containing protein n=1 Tax=Dokdonella sp. TaxID=2291710 RepID=UPI0035280F9C